MITAAVEEEAAILAKISGRETNSKTVDPSDSIAETNLEEADRVWAAEEDPAVAAITEVVTVEVGAASFLADPCPTRKTRSSSIPNTTLNRPTFNSRKFFSLCRYKKTRWFYLDLDLM